MRLHQVAQHVEDLDRAAAFYTGVLGARQIARFDPPGLVFVDLDGVRLLLERGAPSALLYLRVDDARGYLDELRGKGVTIDTEASVIFDDAEGLFGDPAQEWMGFFRDSENNLIGVASRH